ncbi:MAG: PA2169 family four-helix-bundle protein [Acidobacteria bacterium]|nr:PA2169 family four-helix-bundle protein [Acidobacteriota bacterium]
MDTSKAISTLNDLIETCRDGENGFRTAAEGVKDAHVKALFQRFARQRTELVKELQEEVRKLGGNPEQRGSVSGSLHRGWMNIKSLVTGRDDAAIIAEAERGEDVAKATYAKALQENLPAGVRTLIQTQAEIIRLAHDEVRTLEKAHTR